jgi:hypothetical protein
MSAGRYNIEIEQGATFQRSMTLDEYNADTSQMEDLDLTGYTFAGKIRDEKEDTSAMISFTIVITNALTGAIQVSLTAAQTSTLTAGTAYYDIEMTRDSGEIIRLLEGVVNISREITR